MPSSSDATPDCRDDAALVHACRQGDAQAWEQLLRRYQRLIYTIRRRARLDADDAADVFQTMFQRLHRHLDNLVQLERLHAWLVTTAKRETLRLLRERARDRTRARRRRARRGGADRPRSAARCAGREAAVAPPRPAGARTAARACRSLLGLLYGDDEPAAYAHIAAQLGMPEGSIGPTRARCLAKLRTLMESMR